MLRRRLASLVLVALVSIVAAAPASAIQPRPAAASTTEAGHEIAPWSFAGIWNWIQSIFDEEHGQIVP